jgi:hypothetical protein
VRRRLFSVERVAPHDSDHMLQPADIAGSALVSREPDAEPGLFFGGQSAFD